MSGEKPGKRRGSLLAFASLFAAVLINAVLFANRQPAAQQPTTTNGEVAVSVGADATTPSTFSVQIFRDQTRIKLRGQVASEEDHKTILGLVKGSFASLDIVDRMRVGKAAPDTNLKVGGIIFALKVLGYIDTGRASVDERNVSVGGEAGSSTSHPALQATLDEPPAGIEVKTSIVPSIYWRGQLLDDGHLIMTGYVVAEDNKKDLENSAHNLLPSSQVANHTSIVENAPDEWTFVTTHSLKILRNLRYGEVHIKGRTIRIKGAVLNQDSLKAIDGLVEKYPRTYSLESKVTIEPEKASLETTIPVNSVSLPNPN
jgi:hypothetical protein